MFELFFHCFNFEIFEFLSCFMICHWCKNLQNNMIMLDLLKENNKIPKQKIILTDIIEVKVVQLVHI